MLFFKKIVKYSIALLFHYTGLNHYLILRRKKLYVFMFHKISAEVDYLHMSIKPNEIKKIVKWTQSYGEIISLNDIKSSNRGKTHFCITFDDGYKDNLQFTKCCPDTKAIIYLATSYVGTGKFFWADKMQRSILSSLVPSLDLSSFGLGFFKLGSKNNKKRAIETINVELKKLHPQLIDQIVAYISSKLNLYEKKEEVFLNWSDVNQLKDKGIEFGAHTHNHVITTSVSRKELEKELTLCNKIIQDETNIQPTHFAYPNGEKNDICDYYVDILSKHGYKTAVTTIHGTNNHCKDRYMLKRINMTKNKITNPFGRNSKAMFSTLLTNPLGIH